MSAPEWQLGQPADDDHGCAYGAWMRRHEAAPEEALIRHIQGWATVLANPLARERAAGIIEACVDLLRMRRPQS